MTETIPPRPTTTPPEPTSLPGPDAVPPPPAASPGPAVYQRLLESDTHEVPAVLRASRGQFSDADVSIEGYVSAAWHERERERLWKRVWQFACREEHIPEVGDHIIYDIAGLSYVVIRSTPTQIRAFVNACPHRGRQLKDYPGWCAELRCAFHGIAWNLDGTLKRIPGQWEFAHVDPETFRLAEAQVDTWQGFVFINPDPDAGPLADFLGEITEHFDRWDLTNRYVEAHVSKKIRCNWKAAQEAFMECWHVIATHPQVLPYTAIPNCQVDTYPNFARFITPSEVPSPLLDWNPTTEDMLRATLDIRVDEDLPLPVPDTETARQMVIRMTRDKWRGLIGDKIDNWSDAELIDNFTYILFPNTLPWGGIHKLVYRFRPNGNDHRACIMDVFVLSPFTGERPPPAPEHTLGFDESWTTATELALLGKVFDQDTQNLERVQLGLETAIKPGMTLAAYEEDTIKWLHKRLDEWMEDGK